MWTWKTICTHIFANNGSSGLMIETTIRTALLTGDLKIRSRGCASPVPWGADIIGARYFTSWCWTQGTDGNGSCWDYPQWLWNGSFPHSLRLAPVSLLKQRFCIYVKCWRMSHMVLLISRGCNQTGVSTLPYMEPVGLNTAGVAEGPSRGR